MSGGGAPKYNSPSGEGDECLDLWMKTRIASPDSLVIDTISVGENLDIIISNNAIVVLSNTGDIAGAIIGRDAVKLKKCIEKGSDFFASVIAINGGSCDVIIKCSYK